MYHILYIPETKQVEIFLSKDLLHSRLKFLTKPFIVFYGDDEFHIINLYNQGLSINRIATELNLSNYFVQKILEKNKIPIRRTNKNRTKAERYQVIKKLNQILEKEDLRKFKTEREKLGYLSKKLGVSEATVKKYLNKINTTVYVVLERR